MTILHQYTSNAHAGCITIHIKLLLNVGLSQYRCSGEKLLQSEKCLFTLRTPFELGVLLKELGNRLSDLGEVWDESMIITH
jgi:hypothetical protein